MSDVGARDEAGPAALPADSPGIQVSPSNQAMADVPAKRNTLRQADLAAGE